MRIGMLAPIAWRTPPRHYGPWERVVSLLTEGLVQPARNRSRSRTCRMRTRPAGPAIDVPPAVNVGAITVPSR